MTRERDEVVRRIVVEYGRWYVYAYFTDQNGKVLEEEVWKQPFMLERKEVHEESRETFDLIYDHCQDTVLWYATARDEEEPPESGETPEAG